MVDIRFSRNEYTWANQGIVPAMADAVELTKTIQERALEALRAHRATLGEDTAVRIYVGSTEPVGAAHGDFWWNGDSRQRKDSWAGEASRTNLFTDQRPLEAMPNHYVTNGSMSLYLGNEIRYVMTAGGEFRAGFNITGTGTHTFAFEFRSTTVSALRSFHLRTSDGAIDRYVVLPAYEEWLRVEDTVTGPVQVYLTPEAAENPDAGDVVFVKDIIVEAGADAGAFFDGAMPMCSWTGTPGLSTSTYTPGWTLAPALSDLIAILTQTSYEDGFVDIYLGPEIPLFPGEGDLWDDGAEFKVFDGMGWQILIDDTGTVIDETIRDRVKPIVGEIIDPIILPIQEDIEQIGGEVSAVSEWVNVTGAQLDANLAQAQIDLAAAQAALNAAIADLDTLENITLPALDLEITTTQGELDTLANTTIPALYTRLDEAETDLSYLSNTTLPALNTQITDAQSALNAAFPSGVFDVEGALDTTITGTVIEYAVNSSETVAPTTDWSTTQPTRTPGTFVWFRTKITYGSGTTNTSSAALLTGNTGATGPEGPQGSQGIQGPPGDDGVSTYTWLKYADTPTTGMSDTPAGKTYMGLAHNKPTATESSDYGDYQWSLIRGEDGIDGEPGIPGPPGEDGQTTYTWVKYAPNGAPTAAQMSDSPTDMTHIGLAFNKTTATESTVPTDYQWALIQGAPGADGISITSVTPYFLQQVSDTAPAKPTDSPPPAPWTTTEPTWVSGQNLYRTERIIYSDTSFVYTDVSKVAAYAAADAAMLAANSKNTNTYTDLVRPALPGGNPAVTGRRVGDVHRWRYTDNGEVIKEIILNDSNAWQDIQFGDSVLTTLDVGKLTAGTATIQTAVIQALAVEIATVIELAADRITSGTIAAGRIDTTALAAAIATIIELDAGTITSGTIDTARLNATEIAAQIATIIELNADRIVAGEIGAARINTIEMAAALANIITANIENLRVGTGTMDTAVINKLWTDVVRSRKITTDMLIVGSGDNLVADPYFVDTELSNARAARSQGTWTRANESPLDPASPLVFQVSAGSVRYLRLLGVDLSTESTWGSRVEPGTKYRVRYDYRRTGTVSTVTVRPRVRWVNHLGNVSTDTPRAAYAGTTTSWQQDEVEWTAPATAVTAWLEITVNAGSSGTTVQVKNPLFVSKVDPSLMVDGLISAELGLNTSGVVRAGDDKGAATELSLDGISIYTSGESANSRSRRIHLTPYGDQSLHMVGEYEGNPVDFGFDSTGGASARVVTASEDIYIDGRPLLGARIDPTVTEESWLDNSGLGPVAWGDLSAANPLGPVHTGTDTTMIGYITFPVVAGRRYRISMGYGMRPSDITTSGSRIGCHFKYAIYEPGVAAPPGLSTSAPNLLEVQNHVTFSQAVYGTTSFVWNCPTTGYMRLGVTLNTLNCGGALHRASEQAWKLYVDDIGVWTGLPDLAVAPAASPKQTYTSIWTPSSLVTYQGQNNASWGSYNGVQQVNKINQGSWETYYVQRWGVAGFLGNAISGETGKTISSALSGATINSVKVRLSNSFSASPSVKARIGWQSTQTAVPVIRTSSAGISVGSSVTTTLPTAAHTAIAGGNRYITVGPGTTTARSEYAFFHGTTGNAKQIMQLIINYTR